ncbi:hypothetical protein ACI48D_02885 [Massilia sp. LXY-6]|uniref:hypothetical protein n=1 Tax=Massilia sp. LXY-6 TaxID=3379823 RepID=UPI003EE0635D
MAIPIQPKDRRGYFMLPQAPEDAGYYVYGTSTTFPAPAIWRSTPTQTCSP